MSNSKHSAPIPDDLSLRWYKALVNVILYLIAGFFCCNGLLYLTGSIYTSSGYTWEYVSGFYGQFPVVKIMDITYGVLCVLVAAALLLTRYFLSRYHHLAPKLLLIFPIVGSVGSIVYTCLTYAAVGASVSEALPFCAVMIVCVAVFTFVNHVYFKKRDDLFYT